MMSPLGRLDHSNKVWFVISSVLVLVVAALVLSLVSVQKSNDADHRALAVAKCVNQVLALRQTPPTSKTDAAATAEVISAMSDVLTASKDQAAGVYQKFLVILAKDKAVLNANQAFRDAHPYGLC